MRLSGFMTVLVGLLVVLASWLAACQKSPPPAVATPAPAPQAKEAPKARGALHWMEDDFDGAVARAKAAGKPVFVDTWAPWCHTCLSMQSFVLTDPALAPFADRFVYVAIDTEKPSAAPFLAKYPLDVWPTFFILDPGDGSVAGRWLGSMSLHELRAFLEEGERSVQLAHAGTLRADDPLALLRAGDQAVMTGKHADAAKLYASAREKAAPDWPRRTEALVGQMRSLQKAKDYGACVDLGLAEMGQTRSGPDAGDFTSFALSCAGSLPKDDPRVDKVRRVGLDRLLGLVDDTKAPLAADDRGDIWGMIVETREELGDAAGAKEAAARRLAVLDDAAAKAPDAAAASTFLWARAESLLYLGRGHDAVAICEKAEAAQPDDYNPPARLARVHFELKEYGEALAAVDRALAKAYGPRKGLILGLKADILDKQGRKDDARKTIEEQIALYQSLPQARPEAVAAAQKRLDALK